MKLRYWILLAMALTLTLTGCGSAKETDPKSATPEQIVAGAPALKHVVQGPFATITEVPIPADNPMTPPKVELGKMLYFDPRLSSSGVISCATCHNLSLGGTDRIATSLGHDFKTGGRNAPTVLNAAYFAKQ